MAVGAIDRCHHRIRRERRIAETVEGSYRFSPFDRLTLALKRLELTAFDLRGAAMNLDLNNLTLAQQVVDTFLYFITIGCVVFGLISWSEKRVRK